MTTERKWKKPEQADSSLTFVKPSKLGEEDRNKVLVEGTFVEATPNYFDESKSDYKFETAEGNFVVVNNAGNLGYRMKNVSPGELVQLTYLGKNPIENGKMKGKLAHNFDVMVGE